MLEADDYLSDDPRRTAREEAAHAVAAHRLGLPVNYVTVLGDRHAWGRASFKTNGNVPALVVVQLIGKAMHGKAGCPWPPMYCDAIHEEREGLAEVLRLCSISLADYERLADVARALAKDKTFQRDVDVVTEVLLAEGYLNGARLEMLLGARRAEVAHSAPMADERP